MTEGFVDSEPTSLEQPPQGLRQRVSALRTAIRTTLARHTGRSHLDRWRELANFSERWDTRTAALATFVPPGSRVIELGAGRCVLPEYLPPGCEYTPCDLVARAAGTVVCDLNAPVLPDFPPHDIAVCSGVLEYVHNLDRLAERLSRCCSVVVASYAVADHPAQRRIFTRRRHGWVNDYRSEELKDLFGRHGFDCVAERRWRTQSLFMFARPLGTHEFGSEELRARGGLR